MIFLERDKPDDLTDKEWEMEKLIFDWAFIIIPSSFLFVLCAVIVAAKAVG